MAPTLEEFVAARGEALMRFALMLCGDRHSAEDLTQFSGADGASGANGAVSRVWVTFSSCTRRGLDNGTRQAHVSREIVELLMTPLHSGYTTKIG